MPERLTYDTLERISPRRPVDRLAFIADLCRGKRVLDVGCFDETALVKRDTEHWLHGRIASLATEVVGIDMSAMIPDQGLRTGETSIIYRGDGIDPTSIHFHDENIDVIVAGEFIEHIESPLSFFRNIKKRFSGRELVISTPNGVSFANTLLGTIGREVQHPDHVQIFSYKILNTLCERAGFLDWQIIPYRFYATEMILNSHGTKRALTLVVEKFIRLVEHLFPLLSFGYVVRVSV